MKPGLYANIHAKQERIAAGSGEKSLEMSLNENTLFNQQ